MKTIVFLALLALLGSCSVVNMRNYRYEYIDLQTGQRKTATDWVIYLPGDTVVLYPENRKLLITKIQVL